MEEGEEEIKEVEVHVVKPFEIGSPDSLVVTIPHSIRKELKLKKGSHLKVIKEGNKIIYERI